MKHTTQAAAAATAHTRQRERETRIGEEKSGNNNYTTYSDCTEAKNTSRGTNDTTHREYTAHILSHTVYLGPKHISLATPKPTSSNNKKQQRSVLYIFLCTIVVLLLRIYIWCVERQPHVLHIMYN